MTTMDAQRNRTGTCLLIIDMINELAFPEAQDLLPAIEQTAQNIALLKRSMKSRSMPAVYVNDNFGKWRSDLRTLVSHCLREHCAGKTIVSMLEPDEGDYFVLKPKHSGFYQTPLELLLADLDVGRTVVCGLMGNNCVLYTASDAYMRGFEVVVPSDCIVSLTSHSNQVALEQMRDTLKARTEPLKVLMEELETFR